MRFWTTLLLDVRRDGWRSRTANVRTFAARTALRVRLAKERHADRVALNGAANLLLLCNFVSE